MVPEAPLEDTGVGVVPTGEGWFVLNTKDARWRDDGPLGKLTFFEGTGEFWEIGFNVGVLEPGHPMAMYHYETDQEDFLVLSGRGAPHRRRRGAPAPCLGLRPLPARDGSHHRRRRHRALCRRLHGLEGQRGGRLGRLHRRRGRTPSRGGCRDRDQGSQGGVCALPGAALHALSGGLAAVTGVPEAPLDRDGERAAGGRRRLVRRQCPRCSLGRVGRDGRLHAAR